MQTDWRMKPRWIALACLVPQLSAAQPPAGSRDETADADTPVWNDRLRTGISLFAASYVPAFAAAASGASGDAMYVPFFGPWVELYSLPDCERTFCHRSTGEQLLLAADGIVQALSVAFLVASVDTRREQSRVVVRPASGASGTGIAVSGRF